jgi:hypothetical protein
VVFIALRKGKQNTDPLPALLFYETSTSDINMKHSSSLLFDLNTSAASAQKTEN